jgi:hypothetical protein
VILIALPFPLLPTFGLAIGGARGFVIGGFPMLLLSIVIPRFLPFIDQGGLSIQLILLTVVVNTFPALLIANRLTTAEKEEIEKKKARTHGECGL